MSKRGIAGITFNKNEFSKMIIYELNNPIEVHTPLGKGKAIAWIDYGVDINTIWKVVLSNGGSVRNFNDTDIRVYPNLMNGGSLTIPENWKI
jgi:hypothetical protein